MTASTSAGDTDAAIRMKSTPTSSCTRVCWNSSISDTSIERWLASAMPIAVVATKPASSRMRSAVTSAATTVASVTGTAWRGARRCDSASRSRSATTPTAATARPTAMLRIISPGRHESPLSAAWNTTTPSSAPTGSTSTPSHVSSARTSRCGRTKDSSGSTTVGPETTRIAPISSATRLSSPPMSSAAAAAIASQVTSTPTTTRRTTRRRACGAMAATDSRSPASNRITPTAIDTSGW